MDLYACLTGPLARTCFRDEHHCEVRRHVLVRMNVRPVCRKRPRVALPERGVEQDEPVARARWGRSGEVVYAPVHVGRVRVLASRLHLGSFV